MKQQAKRLLSMALVLVMVLSMLPATAMAAGGTESEGSTTPSVAEAFGFKTDPPAGYDANDGVHPFSQSGTNDTINMVPVKEVGLLSTNREFASVFNSSINVYNFDTDSLASFTDDTKLFSNSYSFAPGSDEDTDELFRVASGVAYDPTGSGRDDHVFYYGPDVSIRFNDYENNYLSMKDFSYEGGKEGTVASGRLNPNEGNNEKSNAYVWAGGTVVDEAPDKFLSVIAGNFNGNGEETVVLYDPQYGHFTLQECSVNGESIQTSLVYDLGNEVTVKNLRRDYNTYTLNDMVSAQRNNGGNSHFPKFMPLVHMTAGDLDGDEKDELVVTVTPLTLELSGYYFDCVSTLLVFNKENDGAGNAVWNLKVSKTFNAEGNSVGGAISAIGDFNNDNKNELVLVSEYKFILMKYGNGSLTSLGVTEFPVGGDFMTRDTAISPVYSLPAVGAARMDGTGTASYLYISGEFYKYFADGGAFKKVFDVEPSLLFKNPVRRQPIIGNFDGNLDGKEQIFTAVRGTMTNGNIVYEIECYSTGGHGPRLIYSHSESDADALGRMVLTAPDADTDDGFVMRYTSKEYLFSNPEVMAVLQASPYFEDLLDDYENVGTTGFGTSSGTGNSFSNTVTNTVGAYVSFSHDFEFLGFKVGSIEFQAAYNYEWSKTNETSHTYTTAINYEAGSGSNQVVMIATPVILYHYDVLGKNGAPIGTHNVSVSQAPCYTVIPVEDYNASAELLGNPVINSRCIVDVVPGQPQTYPSSKWQIDSYGGVTVPFSTPVMTSQGNAVVSQEISREDSQSLTKSYSHNIDVSAGKGPVGFVIGASYGHSWGCDSTETVTSEVSRSGSVANIPAGNPDYSFKWQFATWDILVGGRKVPVMGYIVNDVYQPPSVPQNLTAIPGSDSVELTWDHGYNAAVKYDIFRYYPEEQEEYQYDLIGTVDSTETSFVCEGLNPSTRYYFTVRSVGERGLRSKYADPVAVTTISSNQKLPSIQEQPVDRTVNLGNTKQTTFSTLASPTSGGTVTYAWECREDSSSAWETITSGTNVSGYNTRKLTVYNIVESMDGTQYRCRVSERSGAPYPAVIYTRIATLTVGKSNTTTTLLSPTDSSYGTLGEAVTLQARVAASDNSACGGNLSFQITDAATGTTDTMMAITKNDGTATVDWIPSKAGVYTFRAAYAGDNTTEGSASKMVTYYVQETPDMPCYEIVLDGELVSFAHIAPSLKQWSNGQSASVNGAAFELYKYNGTEFEKANANWDDYTMTPGDFRIDAIVNGKVVAQKVFTVSKRPITITAPSIPSIVEGESLSLTQYNDQISYSYELDEMFRSLFKLSGVTAKEPLSGQYDISVVYADPDRPEVADFLSLFQPTFEKSVFTVMPGSEATKCLVTFSAGVNGSLKAYVSVTSTQEITSAQRIPNGSTVFFSPEAADGFTVSKWTINDTIVTQEAIEAGAFVDCGSVRFSGDGLIVEGIKRDITVTVEFTNLSYTVRFSGSGNGKITAIQGSTELSSPVEVCGGSSITFTAAPAEQWVVKSWQIQRENGTTETKKNPDGTDYTGTTLTLENIDDNMTVFVEFEEAADPFAVTYSVVDEDGNPTDGGLVTFTTKGLNENGQGLKGATVTLTANPKPGTAILRWEVYDGNTWVTKEANTDTFTIYSLQADTSIRVVIQPNSTTYEIRYQTPDDAGTLTAKSGDRDISSGDTCTAYASVVFTYVESEEYEFVEWIVDGTKGTEASNGTTHTYTISSLTQDTQVEVGAKRKPVVNFEPNGGSGNMDSVIVASGSYTLPACGFTAPKNMQFKAWRVEDTEYAEGDSIMISGNTTVTAVWEDIPCTVRFDANGGSGSMDNVSVVSGEKYTLPECGFTAPQGKQFKGWATSESGEVITDATITVTGDTTLYAIWEDILYTVRFDANGGSGSMESVSVVSGEKYTLPACEFAAPQGKQFKGWATSENGEVITAATITVSENTTLYAIWEEIPVTTYTVRFDANGGSGSMDAVSVVSGEKYTLPACEFTAPEGKLFETWRVEDTEYAVGDSITISGDITVTAAWKTAQYTITFETNGGTEIEPITVDYGTAVEAPANPSKEGYDFAGWYTDKALTNAFAFKEDTTITENITLYAKWNPRSDTEYTVTHLFETLEDDIYSPEVEKKTGTTDSLTDAQAKEAEGFTAGTVTQQTIAGDGTTVIEIRYERNAYKLTFKPENGDEDIAAEVKYGAAITAPENLTRAGYGFGGWYTDEALENAFVFTEDTTMPAQDLTLYAKWNPMDGIQYTVNHKFENLDGEPYTTDSEELSGTAGTTTAAEAKTVEGFTAGEVTQQIIAGDGSTVIEIIYTRNTHKLTFKPENGEEDMVTTVKYGAEITAPTLEKTGYTFTGWDKEIPATMPDEDVTITAQWTINQYTITFKDGETTLHAITDEYGASVEAPADPTKTGYTFTGWDKEIPATMPAEDVTITAQWEAIQYTITVESTEHGSVTAERNNAAMGDTVTLTVVPEADYALDNLTVTDENGDRILVTNLDDGKYSFTMPASNVSIKAVFVHANHLTELVPAVEATCEHTGNKAYYVCSVCGLWFADEEATQVIKDPNSVMTPLADHTYASAITYPTCTEQGYTTHTCSKCGDSYVDTYKEATGHKWDDGKVTREATCTEAGEKTFTCKACGATKTEVINALGHNYQNGSCTICGKKDPNAKPSWKDWFDKIFGDWWGDDEETCDHVYTSVVTAPTCEEQGYTTHTCSECGDTYKDSYTDALGHAWDEGKVTKEATCTEDGVKTFTCGTCDATKTEVIDALGHTFEDGICTECGEEEASEPETPSQPSWKDWFDKIFGDWWG